MALLSLTYRRPSYVPKAPDRRGSESSSSVTSTMDKGDSIKSGRPGTPHGIPPALTFDKIIDGGTCPPCTVRDFMNYLIYIERSAENLQFFLWYRDYVKRFNEADTTDMALAPEWTQTMEDEASALAQKEHAEKLRKEPLAATVIFKGTDFEKKGPEAAFHEVVALPPTSPGNPFSTPPRTPGGHESAHSGSQAASYRAHAGEAFAQAGIKQPFTIQPFRAEIDRVIATYIMDDGPRQLNLSSRQQKNLLRALAYTTHPSAVRRVAEAVEATLRQQAHPNFIRWSVCNGNRARVIFARGLGASLILAATAAAVLLVLSCAPRAWRALAAVGWLLGAATLMAAWKGMCVVLHGLHHRHVRPWELFDQQGATDGAEAEEAIGGDGEDKNNSSSGDLKKSSFDSFGSGSNSYEDEPWVVRYRRRNIIRKIFDREVWIQEPALRQIQDTIFVQALLSAALVSGLLTAVFVCLPAGDFF